MINLKIPTIVSLIWLTTGRFWRTFFKTGRMPDGGNDVSEDMITEQFGMKAFLLTDCLINKASVDISQYPNGSFVDLQGFLAKI